MTGRRPLSRSPRALTLIALCFIGSSAVRVVNADPASIQQVAALAAGVSAAATALTGGEAADVEKAAMVDCPTDTGAAELIAAIRAREKQLAASALRIADRERLLMVAEVKIGEQIDAMMAAEQSLSETLSLADNAAEKDIMRLVAVYESMKPKSAAPIFDAMDVQFAAGFLARMRKDAAAEILAGMSAENAYSVSVVIASRNARVPTE